MKMIDRILQRPGTQDRAVLRLIKGRPRHRAISNAEIVAATGIPERIVRRIVADLIIDHHKPIGSATGGPAGYYWIDDPDEAEKNYLRLRKRGLKILIRAAVLKGIGRDELADQLRLDLERGLDDEG